MNSNGNENKKRNLVFVSTKSIDKEICLNICSKLSAAGIEFWSMYKTNVHLSPDRWTQDIYKVLSRAVILILLITPNIFEPTSGELTQEIKAEINRFKEYSKVDKGLVILPVKCFEGETLKINRRDYEPLEYSINDLLVNKLGLQFGTKLYEDNDDLIKEIIKYLLNYNDLYLKTHNQLLNLQNYCIQKECISRKVSDYILNSRELSQEKQNTELHIITNEFYHYDFTALSTLAIAENIRKYNVKYIYYYPRTNIEEFKKLKNRVKDYLLRSEFAVVEFDKWLRVRIEECHSLIDFLETSFYDSAINYILSAFKFEKKTDEEEFESVIYSFPNKKKGNISKCQVLIDFLNGINPPSDKSKAILNKEINVFKNILKIIDETDEKDEVKFNNSLAALIQQKFRYVIDLYDFYVWFTKEEENMEYEKMLDRLLDNNSIEFIDETREWINEGNGVISGERNLSEEFPEPDDIIERNLVGIMIPDEVPVYMCYSFCLYVSNQNDVAVAWYACDSAANKTDQNIDENIFIFAPGDGTTEDLNKFKEAYFTLINTIPNAKKVLKEKKCNNIIEMLFSTEG